MAQWVPVPIDAKVFKNIDEFQLTKAQASVENAFQTESGGFARFPGLQSFITLPDSGTVYLHDWRGDLIAATSNGYVYRIDKSGNYQDMTGAPVRGGRRIVFTKGEDELIMAAGGEIIRFAGTTTQILSRDAPLSTHVGFIDNYVIATEVDSGRFFHSTAGATRTWDPLDTFAADGRPDNIKAMLVTPFREILLAGDDSTEQFERLQSGDVPFFRRWGVGEGILEPYTMLFADNAVFMVNNLYEFVRFSGQTSTPVGEDLGKVFEAIDDWTGAWIGGFPDQPLHLLGQKFILLQIPNASNDYGTKGYTFVYDYRKQRWYTLHGWDSNLGVPGLWPGRSYWKLWERTFVGGENGVIYEFDLDGYSNAGATQRFYIRTAQLGELGEVSIDALRIRLKTGVGSYATAPTIMVRAKRDNTSYTNWVQRSLGKTARGFGMIEFGGFGSGALWQFEICVTDACQIEIVKMEAQVTPLGF